MAIFNVMVNATMMLAPWFIVMTLTNENGFKGWLFILVATDISLAIGAKTRNKVNSC